MLGRTSRLAALCVLTAALAAAALGVAGAPAWAAPAAGRAITASSPLEAAVLVELNAVRRAHGLTPLRRSTPLAAAAAAHSRAMAQHGFFRHESRDGSAFWQRVQRFYAKGGYARWAVGENLLWSTRVDAAGAVRLWMQSPPHRKNILAPQWREVGLSAVAAEAAPGQFGGRDVVIITSDFGARA